MLLLARRQALTKTSTTFEQIYLFSILQASWKKKYGSSQLIYMDMQTMKVNLINLCKHALYSYIHYVTNKKNDITITHTDISSFILPSWCLVNGYVNVNISIKIYNQEEKKVEIYTILIQKKMGIREWLDEEAPSFCIYFLEPMILLKFGTCFFRYFHLQSNSGYGRVGYSSCPARGRLHV